MNTSTPTTTSNRMMRTFILHLSSFILLFTLALPTAAQTPTTELVTIQPGGGQFSSAISQLPDISADGRFVVFAAAVGWTSTPYAYRRDRAAQTTEMVSVDPDGTPVRATSGSANAISADGRYVVFSGNVTGGGTWGLFRRDMDAGVTEPIVPTIDGEPISSLSGLVISADARFIAFRHGHVYVYDTDTDTLERVSVASDGSPANNSSRSPAISADGRFVAFLSNASNLVPDDTNGFRDVFVHDRNTGATERVSVASDGSEGNDTSAPGGMASTPSISADGRFVAFVSDASNFAPDVKGSRNVFVHDRETGMTEIVSMSFNPDFPGLGAGFGVANISADGRFVTFRSGGLLVPGGANNGSQIFIRDRESATTERVSVTHDGGSEITAHFQNAIAADAEGRFVVFYSFHSNVVPGGTNGNDHFFVRDRGFPAITAAPDSLDFGEVEVGETGGPHFVELANNGNTDATALTFSLPEGPFTASSSLCGDALPVGESCLVSVTFTPDEPSDATATLEIESAEGMITTLTLTGHGEGGIGTEDDPLAFRLTNPLPNPASGSTSLSLRVPEAQDVTARVYDTLGRQVAVIHDGSLAAGEDVRLEIDTAALATGAYVVRVEGETFAETRRVTVVR